MQKGYLLIFKEYLNRLSSRRCTKFDVEYARKKYINFVIPFRSTSSVMKHRFNFIKVNRKKEIS